MEINLTGTLAVCKTMGYKPNYSELSRQFGIDRHTISKMWKGVEAKIRKPKSSQLDQYKEEIEERLSQPGVRIKSVYWYFKNEHQITCGYDNFKYYVRKNNLFNKSEKVAHVLYETDPGKQLQVDWVENINLETVNGEIITFNLFSATLGFSRYHYFEYTDTKTEIDFKRCLCNCFKTIGGKTNIVLTDNMAALVDNKKTYDRKHPSVKQFEKDLGIEIKLCKVRTPETKGKCETSNKYANWLKAYNKKIEDKNHIIRIINKLNNDINNEINTETKIPPVLLFKKEKEYLLPIENYSFLDNFDESMVSCKVPATLLIIYKGKKYSVPSSYIGKIVRCCESNNQLYIYYNKSLIAQHNISEKNINYLESHYKEGLSNKGLSDDKIEKYTKENLAKFK